MGTVKVGDIYKVTSSNSTNPQLAVGIRHTVTKVLEYCPVSKATYYSSVLGWYMEDSTENSNLTIQGNSRIMATLTKVDVSDT